MNRNDKFTKMEQIYTEFVRISNAIGIEAFEVKDICERWMREELLLSIEQTNKHFSSDNTDKLL